MSELLLPGRVTTADTEQNQYAAFVDGGKLYAIWTREGTAPHLSRIARFDGAGTGWTTVYETDAYFATLTALDGRASLVEFREVPLGGGAHDERIAILDLGTGKTAEVDAFFLSAKTFHGGGGGPRRPSASLVLGSDQIAWTHLNELADGVVEGELRVAKADAPSRFTTVGRSREWIAPLWLDGQRLVYLVGGTERDEIRARDLATGADRSIATLAAPRETVGRAGMARSGDIIGWIDNVPLPGSPDARPDDPKNAMLRTVEITSGARRELDLGQQYCVGLSGNASGFVWTCPAAPRSIETLTYFEPRTQRAVDILRSDARPNGLQAVDRGFLWFDLVSGVRRVNLLTLP